MYYTIVFAKSAELEDLAEAFRANRSLAVEDVEQRFPRYYGDFRLIKFQYFLNREFYPIHDALCAEQAVLLDRVLDGDDAALEELAKQQTAVEDLFKKYYQQ